MLWLRDIGHDLGLDFSYSQRTTSRMCFSLRIRDHVLGKTKDGGYTGAFGCLMTHGNVLLAKDHSTAMGNGRLLRSFLRTENNLATLRPLGELFAASLLYFLGFGVFRRSVSSPLSFVLAFFYLF